MCADEIVGHFKRYIDNDSVESCRNYLMELQMEYEELPWDYIFQKVYVHACLKKRQTIIDWLMIVYDSLDPIQQIAIRQVFSYGRYLLKK
jgi:hypothetical protein